MMNVVISSVTTGKRALCKVLVCALIICTMVLLPENGEEVRADTWNSAREFYSAYGNNAVFKGEGQTNGNIYFGSCGKLSSSGTKYRTIGYKMTIKNNAGTPLQYIYYKMGGSYMYLKNEEYVGGYDYMLYTISLYSLKQRLNATALSALNSGNCSIVLDACMVITKKGKPQGAMTDYGPSSGTVYENYAGIANAAGWSSSALQSLQSYFGKTVSGLFYRVSVTKTAGIESVFGSGTYCYGTYVRATATVSTGYQFKNWNNNGGMSGNPYGFFVTGAVNLTAYSTPVIVSARFHCNFYEDDTRVYSTSYAYGVNGQKLAEIDWKEPGYTNTGWSFNAKDDKATYLQGQIMGNTWLYGHISGVDLYGIWKENQYTIVYDNGVRETHMYSDEIVLPNENLCIGWTCDAEIIEGFNWETTETDMAFKPEETIKIADLCRILNVEYTNNSEIYLYGIWEHAPTIKAQDMFFSLNDVREKRVTEEKIAEKIEAIDVEDGKITYGRNENNYLVITNYDEEEIDKVQDRQKIELEIEAMDSYGNVVNKTICLTFVDTEIKSQERAFGKIRFIDSEYFGENKAGGLMENSRWLKDPEFKNLLQSVLVIE